MSRRTFLKGIGLISLGSLVPAPSDASVSAAARKEEKHLNRRTVNVVVCGGGPSGISAALMASSLGVKVLLLERYGRIGGMAVQSMVNPLLGKVNSVPVDKILGRLGGRQIDFERIDIDYTRMLREAGVEILLHSWVTGVVKKGNRVVGVNVISKEGTFEVAADVVVDATGDGDVAFCSGAEFEQGRPGDKLLQPMSVMYRVSGLDENEAMVCESEEEAKEIAVPGGTWEEVVHRGQTSGELPATIGVIRLYRTKRKGERGVNATQINYVDGTKVEDLTKAETECREQAYTVLDFLKKHAPGYENAYISQMPAVIGVRETRRFIGEEYLTREDLLSGKKWDDAVVRDADFVIDIHNPAGGGQAEGITGDNPAGRAARVKPYDIPYGCLVPRDIDGLILAGRCISGSHDAHASYRVQIIAMAIGAASGTAAALACIDNVQPRKVDVKKIQEVLAKPPIL
jgi:ribulose 1,5-bisphosphate synthetase/thiazole synthase